MALDELFSPFLMFCFMDGRLFWVNWMSFMFHTSPGAVFTLLFFSSHSHSRCLWRVRSVCACKQMLIVLIFLSFIICGSTFEIFDAFAMFISFMGRLVFSLKERGIATEFVFLNWFKFVSSSFYFYFKSLPLEQWKAKHLLPNKCKWNDGKWNFDSISSLKRWKVECLNSGSFISVETDGKWNFHRLSFL